MSLRTILSITLLFILFSCSRQNKVIITGKVDSAVMNEMVYLEELRIVTNHVVDSTRIRRNGRFRSSIELNSPGFYQLFFLSGPSLSLILMPGEIINLTADMHNFYETKQIEGSDNSIRLNVLHDSLRSTIQRLNKIRDEYTAIKSDENEAIKKQTELSNRFAEIKNDYHRYSVRFILEDISSLANIAALYQEFSPDEYVFHSNRDIQFFKLVSDSLSKYYPDVHYVKSLRENYQAIFNDYNTRRLLQGTIPISYDVPELNLTGPDGKKIALSSLKGKIVLLTFWSVNQAESIQNTIDLKKIYKKHRKTGFEIYQVCIDNSLDSWKKAIAFEEIPWISVCDTSYPNSQTRILYNVINLPMNYLIDKQQKEILAKNISPEDLDKSIVYLSEK